MTKKKKDEEHEFKLPEFDEKEYMEKEVEDAKFSFIVMGYSVLMGVVSFLLLTLSFEVAFAVGILAGFGLKFLPLPFGMDITKFDKKKWLGNGIMYILTWLAVLMILCNLPI
ncbi:MAG: hypothetical protein KJ886_00885 [Candidatus Thermoplasmatota archaeon]|nr:hypothetical protein [Candidatus Thermoplasmatota archaeon]MBU4256673.1 hypothetical protein [Candidatus Thermoplasmatota archaeon]MCG2825321.1 hypothetical protein [Thermoplasmatales archaeon]